MKRRLPQSAKSSHSKIDTTKDDVESQSKSKKSPGGTLLDGKSRDKTSFASNDRPSSWRTLLRKIIRTQDHLRAQAGDNADKVPEGTSMAKKHKPETGDSQEVLRSRQPDQANHLKVHTMRQKQIIETDQEAQRLMQNVQRPQQQAEELKSQEQQAQQSLGNAGRGGSNDQQNDKTISLGSSLAHHQEDNTEIQSPHPPRPDRSSSLMGESSSDFLSEMSPKISTMKRRLPQSANSSYTEAETTTDDVKSQSTEPLSPIGGEFLPGKLREKKTVTSSEHPSWTWRIILRKIIYAVITNLDDETLRKADTESHLIYISLFQEAILGITISFCLLSFLMFIDHSFLLGLPMVRNYEKAAIVVMGNNDTLRNFEEDAGLKLMKVEEYDSIINEIAESANKWELVEKILKTRNGDLTDLKKDMDVIEAKFPSMLSEMGLDKFCGECKWGQGLTCERRVGALNEKYQTHKYEGMMSAMEKKSCVKSDEEAKKEKEREQAEKKGGEVEKKMQTQEDELLKDWRDKKEIDWCGECEWDGGMSCQGRADYLISQYGVTLDRAKAKVVISVNNCKKSAHKEEGEKLLARFCEQCTWGNKMTCKQRADYLMHTYKDSEHKAILATMERPSCVNPESSR